MDKLKRDRRGEIFQDELTENQSVPRPPRRDDAEHERKLDPNVDSQEGDRAMAEDRFGRNERYSDEDLIDREIREATAPSQTREESEFERRSGSQAMHRVDPLPPRERAQAVYGETDISPNDNDEKSAHHAEEDEHL